jgi:hypothetical protein
MGTEPLFFPQPWNVTIFRYGYLANNTYVTSSNCYTGRGLTDIGVIPLSFNNEQTIRVTSVELDAESDVNMSLSVIWGAIIRTDSTVEPYGATSVYLTIAP